MGSLKYARFGWIVPKLGKKITARTPNFEYHGIFDSVDEKGQLIIISNGEKENCRS